MKKQTIFLLILLLSANFAGAVKKAANKDFYQIKIYHLKNEAQEKIVDDFLKLAYLPALHRAGIAKAGVFKPIKSTEQGNTAEKLIYVFTPFDSYKTFSSLEKTLEKDPKFLEDGKTYLTALLKDAPYERIETLLLNAFDGSPHFNLPKLKAPMKDRVYELRSYEGPTEALYWNKVAMFNKGDEIGMFKRLNFNAVFFGEVIAGSRMPNLIYLTTFENKADNEEHWKSFFGDDYWKKLSAMPEYQNNVSNRDIRFLYPTDYSDI